MSSNPFDKALDAVEHAGAPRLVDDTTAPCHQRVAMLEDSIRLHLTEMNHVVDYAQSVKKGLEALLESKSA